MFNELFVFGVSILFFTVVQTNAQSLPTSNKIPNDLQINLDRSACFGICPDYSLTIESDGKVIFEGRSYTGTKGKIEDKINRKILEQIISEFEKADFFKLNNNYVEEKDGCGELWTDNPYETISIKLNGKTKQVTHYFGCEKVSGNVLERIINLGEKIDALVNSDRWVKGWKPDKINEN
ncbi:MAG: hypothetical protein H0X15_12780 [Acidobacteria bacterium]|nr:hypothetical protein [Acidobacteriota bacterium]